MIVFPLIRSVGLNAATASSALGFASAGAACKRIQRSGSQPAYRKELLSQTLASRFATESANIIHQIPNVIRGFNFAEGRHSGETDSVLDDPKQLLVGKALHLLAGEVGGAWIHPSPHRGRRTAIGTMTQATLRRVECVSSGDTGLCVLRARRYSLAACPANEEARAPIRNRRLKTARLLQRGQIETHQRNHNQHHSEHEDRPRGS